MSPEEDKAWLNCNNDDLWLFDKLILSRKLGYVCGPIGVSVPTSDWYIVRPISNIPGMGISATKVFLEDDTEHLPPGHFWCEIFTGRHFSIDYVKGHQKICAEGFRDADNFYQWSRWEKAKHHIPLPTLLQPFAYTYPNINCEFIGDKLIEVHLRHSTDFLDGGDVIYPVWEMAECLFPSMTM